MNIYSGNIISCDSQNRTWKYLIEEKGKIHYLGDVLPEEYSKHKIIDLKDKALLPSFGDGHIHFSNWAMLVVSEFDIRHVHTIEDLQQLLRKERRNRKKPKIMIGYGISPHNLKEKRLVIKKELDLAVLDTPLILIGYDGHTAVCNSAMMKLFPDSYRELRGFHEETGQLFNEAYYDCLDFATSLVSKLNYIKSILGAYDVLAEKGIGLIHSVEGIGFPQDLDVTLASLAARAKSRKTGIQSRLFFQTMDIKKVQKRKLPRIGGCFATAIDGCFGACDAALLEPYQHDPENKGILFHDEEELFSFVSQAHKAGLQIALHCIGDGAVRRAVDAFEAALQDFPRKDHRHILIHACLIAPEDLDRIEKLGLGISLQPSFLSSPMEPVEYLQKILGDRYKTGSPYKEILNRGILLTGGSDAPVTPPDPIEGIACAIEHPYDPEQSLTVEQALVMYTRGLYEGSFDDKERGTLEPGKWADMVILNKNPLTMTRPDQIRSLKVEQLLLKGKPYKAGMSLAGMILRGLIGKKVKI